MLGLGLGTSAVQSAPLARYSLGGKAPAVVADNVAGVYGLGGRAVSFDGLFTFSRLSAASKLNALGHWVKVLADDQRTGHHIWKDGMLVPAGVAVCSEVRTNLTKNSEDLTNWTFTQETSVTPQGNLGGSTAFVLSDQTGQYGQITQNVGPIGDGEFTCQVKVAKTGAKGNAFGIRLSYTASGVSTFSGLSFNTETGAVVSVWNSNVIERVVQDCGDYWLAWFSFDATGVGTNDATVQVFPSHNNVNGAVGGSQTGDHRCTGIQVNEGRYPQDYIKTGGTPVSVAAESLQIGPSLLSSAFGGVMPEALTIVMKGSMSYANEGLNPQVRFFNQSVDNDNNLQALLNTVDARTGQMQVSYRENGYFSAVSGAADAFSPGSDVPFSLALVLTATELEGFCNGVSIGKTTHGGIANLLSSPMELFPSGIGTIEHFAIYTGNPGAAALQEATA